MHYDKDSGLTLWKYDRRLTWIILDNLAMLIEYIYPDDRLIEIRIRALCNIVVQCPSYPRTSIPLIEKRFQNFRARSHDEYPCESGCDR